MDVDARCWTMRESDCQLYRLLGTLFAIDDGFVVRSACHGLFVEVKCSIDERNQGETDGVAPII